MRVPRWIWFTLAVIAVVVSGVTLIAAVYFRWWQAPELVSPLSQLSYIQVSDVRVGQKPKQVYGYMPYWTMNEATAPAAVTDVLYFSVSLNKDGSLQERVGDELDMGLRRLQSEAAFGQLWEETQLNNQRLHVTITVMDPDVVNGLLRSEAAREQAIDTIAQLVSSYPFVGVNLDLEYAGRVDDELRDAYSQFIRDTGETIREQDSSLELSVAVFGSAGSKYTIWDIPAWHESVDHIVVMAYDYHVRSSTTAGPVAPIFGKGTGRWQDDVVTNIRDILKTVPSEKILLGIPFYGYEWSTTSAESGAFTLPDTGSTATYRRVQELLSDPEVIATERWDADALAPYVVYEEDGQTQIIYYENSRSIAYKMDFVQQLDLAGVAIWAVGYEGPYSELWQVIGTKLRTSIN